MEVVSVAGIAFGAYLVLGGRGLRRPLGWHSLGALALATGAILAFPWFWNAAYPVWQALNERGKVSEGPFRFEDFLAAQTFSLLFVQGPGALLLLLALFAHLVFGIYSAAIRPRPARKH